MMDYFPIFVSLSVGIVLGRIVEWRMRVKLLESATYECIRAAKAIVDYERLLSDLQSNLDEAEALYDSAVRKIADQEQEIYDKAKTSGEQRKEISALKEKLKARDMFPIVVATP